MRTAAAVAMLFLLSACAAGPERQGDNALETPSDLQQCTEPRPQICTLEYRPTCGFDAETIGTDYASPCNACADAAVVGYRHGACDE